MKIALFVLAWYTLWSLATFIAFWLDKRAAARGRWRTPEKTLFTLCAAGGFPGAMAAMSVVRHKNRKPEFVMVVWALGLVHIVLWAVVLFKILF